MNTLRTQLLNTIPPAGRWLSWVCLVVIAFGQQAGALGQISGLLTSANGTPVPGGLVSAHLLPSAGSQVQTSTANAISAADGSFSVQQLVAGTYRICVQVPGAAYLDPCQWSTTATTVPIAAGQAVTGVQIQLQSGVLLKIHVKDPSGHLEAHEGKTRGAHLLVGVWTSKGLLCPAYVATKDSGQREYRVTVPYNTPLKLSVYSKFFRISDKNKNPVNDSGAGTSIQATNGQPAPTFEFNIDGIAP